MSDTQSQQTLTADPDAEPRAAPRYCPECGDRLVEPALLEESLSRTQIWRRHRRTHYGWGDGPTDPEEPSFLLHDSEHLDDGDRTYLEMAADQDVAEYTVEFHEEHIERVTVEAATKSEAKDLAEDKRTHNTEPTHVVHTDVRKSRSRDVPSVEYLEKVGLLPKSIRESELSDEEIRSFIASIKEVGL
jgi:hypothetical protein